MEDQTVLTFGQKAVGLTFNPSNNPDVQDLKEKAAAFIDACQTRIDPNTNGEIVRMLKVAITEAQTAQMWAVKAVTWTVDEPPGPSTSSPSAQ